MDTETKKRKDKLEECIRNNPHSSTTEKEQLNEIEEQERGEWSENGEVKY